MSRPRISIGIPLYRSRPFLGSLRENCAALAAEHNIEVIVSDRHGFDDTLGLLALQWRHDPRFRFLKADDQLNWVEHMNLLMREAQGDYFRWMPHDDCFPAGCLAPLADRLEQDPATILAYGPTRAIDSAGIRQPQWDRLHTCPVASGETWRFSHSLDLFWNGSCDGAFKGLFRRAVVMRAGLYIRPTYQLVHAERVWLFGVSLLGGLSEEPSSLYLKRYHSDSTHAKWRPRTRHIASATWTMCGYLRDFGTSPSQKLHGMAHLWMRAGTRINRLIRQKRALMRDSPGSKRDRSSTSA